MPAWALPVSLTRAVSAALPRGRGRAGRALWAAYAALGVLLLTYLALLIFNASTEAIDGWGVVGVEVVASAMCVASGLRRRAPRSVPLVLGAALFSWTAGDVALTIESAGGAVVPTPSVADAFYLAFFAFAYVALVLYLRGEVRRLASTSWLDGAIAALGTAALCAAFAFREIEHLTGDGRLATAVNLAYPVGDVLLLTLVVAGTTFLAGRSRGPWLLLASGIGLNVAGDTFNLFGSSIGATHAGTVVNGIAWPAAIWLMSMAMWLPRLRSDPLREERSAGFVLPGAAAASGLAVLLAGTFEHLNGVALGLAGATLLLVCARTGFSVKELRDLTEERRRQSVTDPLTGLRNRRYLFEVLEAFFAEQAAAQVPGRLAFLFIDLERFKQVNDSFGHPAGDEILRQVGGRLASALGDGDLVARIGGDEFAVVLMDAERTRASAVAEAIKASLEEPFGLQTVRAQLGASIGIALAPEDASNAPELVWSADVAMYRAKFGSASYAFYEHDFSDRDDRLRLAEELGEAIKSGELALHYQPQLDLRAGAITSAEALVRWPHPSLGLIPPLKFLPLAEEAGLMPSLTELVLRDALEQCAAWRAGGSEMNVSVNVSASDLCGPPLAPRVESLLERFGLPASCLVVEITETSVISEFERTKQAVSELRDLGVVVSIDDFGAGFTSLAYLSGLAVGELKLDRALLAQLTDGHARRDLQLVKATIDLGHALGLRVVAEGIESQEMLDLVSGLGCDVGQGFFIGAPKPADKFAFRPLAPAPRNALAEPRVARLARSS